MACTLVFASISSENQDGHESTTNTHPIRTPTRTGAPSGRRSGPISATSHVPPDGDDRQRARRVDATEFGAAPKGGGDAEEEEGGEAERKGGVGEEEGRWGGGVDGFAG